VLPGGIGYLAAVGRGLQLYSGRVIALGRLLLAISFLVAIGVDISQPAQAPTETFALLIAYVVFAATVTVATWSNWWLDAKLAGPAHAVDIGLFTVLVLLTEGYTSPFFVFFVFLLLAAAIRWGWRETALTAILVTILYLVAGLVAASSSVGFHLYRFIIRTGQLVSLSLILIWFGIHQWRARIHPAAQELLAEPTIDRSPLETGLAAAMEGLGASRGAFIWLEGGGDWKSVVARDGELSFVEIQAKTAESIAPGPFLYDVPRERTLSRDAERNLFARLPDELIGADLAAALELGEGLAVPVRTGTGEGQLFLEGMRSLSTDHIDLGEQLAVELAAHIQRHALLRAAADSAEARSRLALARDLHDSVVQFLAGAAFRLEAMKRSEASGRQLEPELNELKKLMMQEQGELRAFITALRSGSRIPIADLARDLQALTERLSRQWDIDCEFSAEPMDAMVSTDVHLDAHQLVREAVANAVRHAGAKSVRIALAATRDTIRLDMVNDGAAYPRDGEHIELPQSLKERVEQAGGELELSRGMDVTKLSISLPIAGRNR
jgi:signal transduction histidine kinase